MNYSIQILQHDSIQPMGTSQGMQTEVSKLIFSTRFKVNEELSLDFVDKLMFYLKENFKEKPTFKSKPFKKDDESDA